MPSPSISFSCQQCSKRFSAPASASGKQVTCSGCGAKVTVPDPSAPAAIGPAVAPVALTPSPFPAFGTPASSPAPATVFAPPVSAPAGGFATGSTGRRDFPALKFVAVVIVILSWLYVVVGVLAGLGVIGAAGSDGLPGSLFIGVGVVLLCLLVAVFIRAGAEMIRLLLYVAELLEDIRAK